VARRFDLARRELSGDPVTVAESVAVAVVPRGAFSISATGVIAYRTGGTNPRQLTWFDRTGKALATLGEPDRANLLHVALSRDGRRAAVARTVQNNVDIWLMDSTRTTRFTSDMGNESYPIWSPDGTRIVFTSNKLGPNVYQRVLSGAVTDELLFASPQLRFPSDWSVDGRFLLYMEVSSKTAADLWVLPMDGEPAEGRKPSLFLSTSFNEQWGQFSPDGRWVAYQSNETGRVEIYVRPFPGPGGQWPVSTSGGVFPRWAPNGKELYYLAPDGKLIAASIAAKGATLEVGTPVALFQTRIVGGGANLLGGRQEYDVAPDGRFLINVATETASAAPITLLMNWNPDAKK
jgi:WD40-like Beta Propeller Repeat